MTSKVRIENDTFLLTLSYNSSSYNFTAVLIQLQKTSALQHLRCSRTMMAIRIVQNSQQFRQAHSNAYIERRLLHRFAPNVTSIATCRKDNSVSLCTRRCAKRLSSVSTRSVFPIHPSCAGILTSLLGGSPQFSTENLLSVLICCQGVELAQVAFDLDSETITTMIAAVLGIGAGLGVPIFFVMQVNTAHASIDHHLRPSRFSESCI